MMTVFSALMRRHWLLLIKAFAIAILIASIYDWHYGTIDELNEKIAEQNKTIAIAYEQVETQAQLAADLNTSLEEATSKLKLMEEVHKLESAIEERRANDKNTTIDYFDFIA